MISPLLSNLYPNQVDRMLERAKDRTREGGRTHIEYARFADDHRHAPRRHAALYDKIFADSPLKPPKVEPNNLSIYHQYTVTASDRDKLQKFLTENKISSAVFYPKPLHVQDCFGDLGYREGDLPVAEKLCTEVLSLPIYPELTAEQVEYVAKTALEFYGSD